MELDNIIKKLQIRFDNDGLWRIDTNYDKLTNAETQALKDCIVSISEDLDMDEKDFNF